MFVKSINNIRKKIIYFFISLSPFTFFLFFLFNNLKLINKKNLKILLYIKSPKFDEEIELLSKMRTQNKVFIPISARLIKTVYSKFFPIKYKYINDYNYDIEIQKNTYNQKHLANFWIIFFKLTLKFYNIKCVINPNFIYTYLQEFNRSAQLSLIKNVTIYKEGINPPEQNNYLIKNYYSKKKYTGDFIFFKNESIKNAFENILKIENTKTFVSGLLNIDDFCNVKNNKDKNIYRATLFFSYAIEKKKVLGDKIFKELNVDHETESFYVNFIKITNILTKNKFIIKLKKNDHLPPFKKLLKKNNLELKDNVKLICNEKSVLECIKNSSIICSFNSSSLIEALVLKKTIIEPRLNWSNSNRKHNFLKEFEHLSLKSKYFSELLTFIKEDKKIKYNEEEIKHITRNFFGHVDGKNRIRLIQKLEKIF